MRHSAYYPLVLALDSTKYASFFPSFFSQIFALFLLHFFLLRPCFNFTLSGTSGRNYPFSIFLYAFSGCPITHFFRVMALPMCWPDEVRIFKHLQSHVAPLLFPLVSTHLFFRAEGVLSAKILQHTGSFGIHRGTCAPS